MCFNVCSLYSFFCPFISQAKLQAVDSLPYGNSGIVNSTASMASNGRKSESELPLTASFQTAGFQQWDSQGRAVGYAPDPTLYAPQPQRPVKITAPPSTSSQRSTPAMSERLDGRAQPIRSPIRLPLTLYDRLLDVILYLLDRVV